jgi:integrase
MTWAEVQSPDTWIIPGARYKNARDHLVPLSAKAQAVLLQVKRREGCALVFSNNGQTPMSGWTKLRRRFGKRVTAANDGFVLPVWTLHDLRRTARTLMSRAGVSTDHAERVLGHTMDTLRGTYDVWGFEPEKRSALARLAIILERITDPPADEGNIVTLHSA